MVETKHIVLILAMLPMAVFGQVPDTDNFGLDTVVTVVGASSPTLQTCFDEADAGAFDATHEGNKDRLSNFRNYEPQTCTTNICQVATITNDAVYSVSGNGTKLFFGKLDGLYAYNDYDNGLNYLDKTRNDTIRGIDAVDSAVVYIEGDGGLTGQIFQSNDTWATSVSQWSPTTSSRSRSIEIDTTRGNHYMYAADDGDDKVRRATVDLTDASFSDLTSFDVPYPNLSGVTGVQNPSWPGPAWGVTVMKDDTLAYLKYQYVGASAHGSTPADSSSITARIRSDDKIQYFIANGTHLSQYQYDNTGQGGTAGDDYLPSNARDIEVRNDTLFILMDDRIELRDTYPLTDVFENYYVDTQSGNIDLYIAGRYIYVASRNGLIIYEIQ
jgi:hypothetical protein